MRSIAVIMTCLICTSVGCRPAAGDREARALAAQCEAAWEADDLDERGRLIRRLEAMGERALPALEMMYGSKSFNVRYFSTARLGSIDSAASADALVRRLDSPDKRIRFAALNALAGQTNDAALAAAEGVFDEPRDHNDEVLSAVAMGSIYHHMNPGPRRVFDKLLKKLEEGMPGVPRRPGLAGLQFCGTGREYELEAVPAILKILQDEPQHVSDAYTALVSICGREFGGVPLPWNQKGEAAEKAWDRMCRLESDAALRARVCEEAAQWLRHRRRAGRAQGVPAR